MTLDLPVYYALLCGVAGVPQGGVMAPQCFITWKGELGWSQVKFCRRTSSQGGAVVHFLLLTAWSYLKRFKFGLLSSYFIKVLSYKIMSDDLSLLLSHSMNQNWESAHWKSTPVIYTKTLWKYWFWSIQELPYRRNIFIYFIHCSFWL